MYVCSPIALCNTKKCTRILKYVAVVHWSHIIYKSTLCFKNSRDKNTKSPLIYLSDFRDMEATPQPPVHMLNKLASF